MFLLVFLVAAVPRQGTGGEGRLQVEAPGITVNVDELPGKEESGYDSALHTAGTDFPAVHAACGDSGSLKIPGGVYREGCCGDYPGQQAPHLSGEFPQALFPGYTGPDKQLLKECFGTAENPG